MTGLLRTGVSSIAGAAVIGSIPSMGVASAATMKTKAAEGLGNVGKTFPAMGKITGAGMVIKASRRLRKKGRKL